MNQDGNEIGTPTDVNVHKEESQGEHGSKRR